MVDPISVPDAARELELSPARVRAMASQGQLRASKIAGRWLVERSAVERHQRQESVGGRRFTAQNAWALLMLASEEEFKGITASVRSRLKRALAVDGLSKLAPRLRHRAELFLYRAHPGEIVHTLDDRALMPSGISAAASHDIGLVSGGEADGYVAAAKLQRFIKEHALTPAAADGNVRLRVVPDEVWTKLGDRSAAPRAAVALDLMEDSDPRSREAGRLAIRELDHRYRVRARARR